jgi:hypothetical protein
MYQGNDKYATTWELMAGVAENAILGTARYPFLNCAGVLSLDHGTSATLITVTQLLSEGNVGANVGQCVPGRHAWEVTLVGQTSLTASPKESSVGGVDAENVVVQLSRSWTRRDLPVSLDPRRV